MRHSHGGFQTRELKRSIIVPSGDKSRRLKARSRIVILFAALAAMAFTLPLLDGCKKSTNGPTAPSLLQGDPAFHASAVAEYQSLGAGVSYPFVGLGLASPTGSPIHTRSVGNPSPLLLHALTLNRVSQSTDTLTFVPALDLYTDGGKFAGNVVTVSFFTDAAATQPAGSFMIKLATNLTNPSDPTSYASYPAFDTIIVNLTGGNLPCQGNVLITFTGGTGANSMTGTMTLTRDNVVFALNLGLSDQLDVTGSITITESGATLQITNVQGKLTGTLTCNATVSPYGWSGTGTLNLLTGSMSANINTGTGNSTAASDNSGNLNIKYADGTQETVNNALSGGLTGNNTGGGPNPSYNAPLIFTSDQRTIVAINNNGQSIGYLPIPGGYYVIPVYWATPTAQAETLHIYAGDAYAAPASINDHGEIVGTGHGSESSQASALYWSSPTAQPQKLAIPTTAFLAEASSINNSGEIVGWAGTSSGVNLGLYWASPTAQPQVLQPLAGYTGAAGSFIAPNGQIIGTVGSTPAFWASPAGAPNLLTVLSGDYFSTPMSVNAAGTIAGASSATGVVVPAGVPHAVTWASVTASAQALPLPAGFSGQGYATSISTAGVIVGALGVNTNYDGGIWKNGKVFDLNTLIPAGNNWSVGAATLITDQGWILGTAYSKQNSNTGQYILIPKWPLE